MSRTASESLRANVAEGALDCVVILDGDGIVREWNESARRTFGHRKEAAVGRELAELIMPAELGDQGRAGLERMTSGDQPILGERMSVTALHARGGSFPVELITRHVQVDPPLYAVYLRDVSEIRRRGEENERFAAIVRSSEDAIITKDLDGIVTAWNRGAEDVFGYSAAEAIGQPLEMLIVPPDRRGESEQASRMTADGGSVAYVTKRVTKAGNSKDVSMRAFAVRNLAGEIVGISASAHDITERRRREKEERENTDRRLWRRRIEEALANNRFVFWGQPVIDMVTGALHHHELLIRMELDGRIVAPGEFLPHAESSELITEIDRWAVKRGIAFSGRSPVAINLSARSLANPRLIDFVRSELIAAGTPPGNVLFEITETAAAENLDAARVLVEQLRELECGVALDDFGTGFGSFTYLKYLPVTELKIDMSFIRGLLKDESDRRVVRSIVMVAKTFEMETVAEGVEDAATLELLGTMDVDLVQGYHLGRPAPLGDGAGPATAARPVDKVLP